MSDGQGGCVSIAYTEGKISSCSLGYHLNTSGVCQKDKPVPRIINMASCSDGLVLDTNF